MFLLLLYVFFLGLLVFLKLIYLIFELLSFFGFIMVLFCIMVGEGIFVIWFIVDVLVVGWVVYVLLELGWDIDVFGEGFLFVFMLVFGSDDDEVVLVGSRVFFVKF